MGGRGGAETDGGGQGKSVQAPTLIHSFDKERLSVQGPGTALLVGMWVQQ